MARSRCLLAKTRLQLSLQSGYWPTWWPADRILAQAQQLVNTLNTTGEKLEDMTKSLKALQHFDRCRAPMLAYSANSL